MLTYNSESLSRDSVTTSEVDEVLQDNRSIWLDLGVSRDGNDRLMFGGFTRLGRLLEVGMELIGKDEYVFHAMDAGEACQKEFNHAWKGDC